jgi:hypothetical protein
MEKARECSKVLDCSNQVASYPTIKEFKFPISQSIAKGDLSGKTKE